MSRVNVDGKVWKEPRVKRLARRCSMSMRETVGTLVAVWDVAYDAKSEVMTTADVDTAAETEGFAAHMVTEDLAEPRDGGYVRIRGIGERIGYLLTQAERGRLGGRARAKGAIREPSGRLASAKQTLGEGSAKAEHSPALPLPPDPAPVQDPDQREAVAGKPAGPARAAAIAALAVSEINRLARRSFEADAEYVVKDCKALAKTGYSDEQVTAVIRAKHAEWSAKLDMADQFKPSVILRPSNFARYLSELNAKKPAPRPISSEPPTNYDEPQTAHLFGAKPYRGAS